MTDEEILSAAESVGLLNDCLDVETISFCILAFAKQIAKLERHHEREACAKLAEEYGTWGGSSFYEWFKKLGAEIRARGES
jgi:hypothetical protein